MWLTLTDGVGTHRLLNMLEAKIIKALGRGGGQVVSTLAYYSDHPISNPAQVYSFFKKNGRTPASFYR